MKKIKITVILILLFALVSLTVACNKKKNETPQEVSSIITIVIEKEAEKDVKTLKSSDLNLSNGLLSVFDYLKIEYKYEAGDFSKIDSLTAGVNGDDITIIEIYTSKEKDQDTTEYSKMLSYEEYTLRNINCEATQLDLTGNTVILIRLETL